MKNKPNRKTIRLQNYDYSTPGWYYVTICTHNRNCIFGDIVNGEMVLNNVGEIVKNVWQKIPKRFQQIKLDLYQIMPNHIHGIININDGRDDRNGRDDHAPTDKQTVRRPTLGKIIAYFKYQSTKYINNYIVGAGIIPPHMGVITHEQNKFNNNIHKIWQRNYHEHIIRNQKTLNKIREYIQNNPLKWILDNNNPINMRSKIDEKILK